MLFLYLAWGPDRILDSEILFYAVNKCWSPVPQLQQTYESWCIYQPSRIP
jgi:hypothetical protein